MTTDVSEISERAQTLLKSLINRYISDGQPVGSRLLAKDIENQLSPATIRNVMADLEDLGLIAAPHTSAGRVPTAKGYRLFVDQLLTIKPMQSKLLNQLEDQIVPDSYEPDQIIANASNLLSSVTKMAGVVMLPRHTQVTLRQIEFLPLTASRILVILVVNNGEVINKVIQPERSFSASELQQTANFLNQEFVGTDLTQIRDKVLNSMQEVREDMAKIMAAAVEVADQVIEQSASDDYLIAGQTNLMHYSEMGDLDKLKQLFDAFNTKQDVLHLLDHSIQAEGINIYIGEESGYTAFDGCSVVTSPYKQDDEVVGVLGVIGPTRMAYDRVIPVVDVTAKLLGSILNSEN